MSANNDDPTTIPKKRNFDDIWPASIPPPQEERRALPFAQHESNDFSSSDQLCNFCKKIDLKHAFGIIPQGINGRKVFNLMHRSSHARISTCCLCRLFTSISPKESGDYLLHLRAFPGKAYLEDLQPGYGSPSDTDIVLGVCRGRAQTSFGNIDRRLCFSRGVLGRIDTEDETATVQPIDRENANFRHINAWLNDCKSRHLQSCGGGTRDMMLRVKCIDCRTRTLVDIEPNSQYYAISYVWGSSAPHSNATSSEQSDRLPSSVSQVIEDSIFVVLQLGGRYLWVDKYCIDQDDAAERHRQIQSMDKIYEGAIATIVAAAGEDAKYGLPGVNGHFREIQPTLTVDGILLATGLPRLPLILAKSKWATRGWTYQEAVLSRRCIFFTDHQVYLICRGSSSCEAIRFTPGTRAIRENATRLRADIFDVDLKAAGKRRAGLWEFFDHLYHYKRRYLSYENDNLNAFQGILAKFSYTTVCGIPIAPLIKHQKLDELELAHAFARGLWWFETPLGDETPTFARHPPEIYQYVRQPLFPSWSWAGWTGKIPPKLASSNAKYLQDEHCNDGDTDLKVWLGNDTHGQLSLSELIQLSGTLGPHFNAFPVLYIEADTNKLKLQVDKRSIGSATPMLFAVGCSCPLQVDCLEDHGGARYRHIRMLVGLAGDDSSTRRPFPCEAVAVKIFTHVPTSHSSFTRASCLVVDERDSLCTLIGTVVFWDCDEWTPRVQRRMLKLR